MRRTARALATLSACVIVGGLTARPATAAEPTEPPTDYAWTAIDTTSTRLAPTVRPPAPTAGERLAPPKPLTGRESAATRAALADDLKTECQSRPEARTPSGWTKDRFQQCFLGKRDIALHSRQDGTRLARIMIDYSVLAFTYDGSRKVDYVFSFDDFDTEGGEPLPVTTLSV